jgi:hypothetical protein
VLINRIIRKGSSVLQPIPCKIKKKRLKRIYNLKNAQFFSSSIERTDPEIINLAETYREDVISRYKRKYSDKPYRFLFHLPSSGVGIVWFKDLIQTLEHTGIACTSVSSADPAFKSIWNEFQPNVFISIDFPEMLNLLDLDFIQQYKAVQGCMRLFTPYPKYKFPHPGISKDDLWRLDLARSGKSADAFFSMYDSDYFSMFLPEWTEAGFKYLSLPHGCNPHYQYPLDNEKKYDYFIATSYGPERVNMTWNYMKPIFEKYHGLWAGPGWGFGMGTIDHQQLPQYYSQAKIVPNPMAANLLIYPMEISERAFSSLACGAFQITDWTPITKKFFAPDELVQVNGRDQFIEKFEYYITRPDERNEIIMKGMKRLYAEHTYFHRIDSLISFLDENITLI